MELMGHEAYGVTGIVMGATAVATSLALHLYPIPTFWRIKKQNSRTEELLYTHYPYYGTHLACLLWILYSIPTAGSTLAFHEYCLLIINIFGVVIQIAYISFYLRHSRLQQQAEDMQVLLRTEIILVLFGSLIIPPPLYNAITGPNKHKYLGPGAVVFVCLMHASHLITITDAYQTKRIKYLPIGMCTIYLLDAVAWFAYGYAYAPTYDFYIALANGIGIVLEVMQLLLCVILFMKYKPDTSKDVLPNDLDTHLLAV